jgi:Mn-dependent DtxR family transcriptional regulator
MLCFNVLLYSLAIMHKITMRKRELVIKLLKNDEEGFTLVEIARKLEISRNTVAVILAELKGAGLIRVRPVGMAKLNYWKKRRGSVKV